MPDTLRVKEGPLTMEASYLEARKADVEACLLEQNISSASTTDDEEVSEEEWQDSDSEGEDEEEDVDED